jgi:Tfp pilus assembly PilM family ATPase
MNRLLDWLESNPMDRIKLFSDSLQEAKVGNQKKITGKETKLYIYHKIAHAIFSVNENQVIRENYTTYLDKFSRAVENCFQMYVSYLLDDVSIDYTPMPDSREDTMRSARL